MGLDLETRHRRLRIPSHYKGSTMSNSPQLNRDTREPQWQKTGAPSGYRPSRHKSVTLVPDDPFRNPFLSKSQAAKQTLRNPIPARTKPPEQPAKPLTEPAFFSDPDPPSEPPRR